jgi:hypothetical protein
MRLLPNVLLNSKSAAETRVFELLEDIDIGDQWLALHSVNCSRHAYKKWAEIDFLLLGPKGIFVLEVKGGAVKLLDGIWTYTDRFGVGHTSDEGPFVQARTAMYAFVDLLKDRYGLGGIIRPTTVTGFGVVFPNQPWPHDTVEMPGVIVADRHACQDPVALTRFLKRFIDYWNSKYRAAADIAPADLQAIRSRVRPDIDVYPPFSAQLGTALADFQRLTDEQYERLGMIEENERVIVSGGAGTGKTFLMLQAARRSRAKGNRVLVVTESPTLAAQLRLLEPDAQIDIRPFGKLDAVAEPVDVLFVDEGQDLMTMDALDKVATRLRGGLEQGCWRWFMDENNQAHVSGGFDVDAYQYLCKELPSGKALRLPLAKNVRNTPEIISKVVTWTNASIGRAEWTGHGEPPELVTVAGSDDLVVKVAKKIEQLLASDVTADQIGIVTPPTFDPAAWSKLPDPLRRLLVRLDPAVLRAQLGGRILWGTSQQFKGLERPVILVAGFSGAEASKTPEFYVAATRANFALVVFGDRRMVTSLR